MTSGHVTALLRLILWPFGFLYGFLVGSVRSFVSEFRRAYRQQRRKG